MEIIYYPWLKSLANVFQNLSAAWFGLALVTPNFTSINTVEGMILLILYCLFGMLFLSVSALLEKILIVHYE